MLGRLVGWLRERGARPGLAAAMCALFCALVAVSVATPAPASARTVTFPNGGSANVSSDGSTITGNCTIVGGYLASGSAGGYRSTVIMPDGTRLTGVCYETVAGYSDHNEYPGPGDGTYSFTATRRSDGTYNVLVHSQSASTVVPGAQWTGHVRQRVWAVGWPPSLTGYARLRKVGSGSNLTDGNICYTLEGATYAVYNANGQQVATLTTDANGNTNTVELDAGTYTVKETSPSLGYKLDPNTYTVTVEAGETAVVSSTEPPLSDPLMMNILKRDKDTGGQAQANLSLAGAEFTIKFYAGWYDWGNLPGTPTKTWVLKTDAKGETSVYQAFTDPSTYFVSGPSFYTDEAGRPCLPLGTVVVQETKAPAGYNLPNPNDAVLQKVLGDGNTGITDKLNDVTVPEPVIRGGVEVQKWDALMGTTTPVGDADYAGVELSVINMTGGVVSVDGKTYADGQVCKVITLDASGYGTTGNDALPYGHYQIRETKGNAWYKIDPDWVREFDILKQGDLASFKLRDQGPSDTPIAGDVKVQKRDLDTDWTKPEGEASFAGARIQIKNVSKNPVKVEGRVYAVGEVVKVITTDASGVAQTVGKTLPAGSYELTEVTPPEGYLLNTQWRKVVHITEDGKTYEVTGPAGAGNAAGQGDASGVPDQVIRGGVEVQKYDADLGGTEPTGDADFAGIELSIYNRTGHDVFVDGKTVAPGAVVKVITLDAGGHAATGDHDLPFGTYEVRETKTNQWYRLNEAWTQTFRVTQDGQVFTFDGPDVSPVDAPIRGDLEVRKRDLETDWDHPQGEAKFEGAQIAVTNRSAGAVKVLGKVYQPGDVVMTLTLDENGHATTVGMDPADSTLPAGTYELTETKAPEGYLLNETWKKTVRIREDRKLYSVTAEAGKVLEGAADDSAVPDQVIRGGVKVQKWDTDLAETGQPTHSGDADYAGIELSVWNRTGHDVYVDGKTVAPDKVALVLTLDADGKAQTDAHALPYGTYEVTETKTNAWYRLNRDWTQTFRVTEDGVIHELTTQDKGPNDEVIRGGVKVQKRDLETDWTRPQGEAKLSGAQISITNRSANPVKVDGKIYQVGEVVKVIETDEAGVAQTDGTTLPAGTYELREVKAPEGYLLNETWTKTIKVREDGKVYEVTDEAGPNDPAGKSDTSGVPDQVIRGGLDVQKYDEDLQSATHSGDSDFAGIELTIWNKTGNDVVVDGKVIHKDEAAKVITLDAEGRASTGDHALPYGTYEVTETKTNQWYRPNPTWKETFRITTDGQVFHASGYERDEATNQVTGPSDAPIRGDVDVQKRDLETDLTTPLGAAKFKGAEISITNRSANAVKVDGSIFQVGEVVKVITTDEQGLATTRGGEDGALPAGTYELTETKAPEGYLLNTTWKKTVQVREDGKTYEVTAEAGKNDAAGKSDTSGVPDQVIRGEVRFDKEALGTEQPLANVAFKVTSKTTGETHVIVTDEKGAYDSSVDVQRHTTYTDDEGVEHKTNANDGLVNDEGWQVTDESKLDPKAGTWFYGAKEPNGADPSDSLGAYPYDTYTFEELRSSANMGFQLLKFDVKVEKNAYKVDGGIIKDTTPTMKTTLTDKDGFAELEAKKDLELHDKVDLGRLQAGKKYTLEMRLWDKTAQEFIKGEDGNDLVVTQDFTPEAETMTVDQTATIDASGLAAHLVVAYEKLYDDHGTLLLDHSDEEDLAQAVTFAKIGTTATATDGNKDIPAVGNSKLLDRVDYEGLRAGSTYTLKATVHVRNDDGTDGGALLDANGNEVFATKTFVATAWKGSVTVEFPLDASALEGKKLVAFEELWLGTDVTDGGHKLTEHKEPGDDGQTVRVPAIGTQATGEAGSKVVRAAGDAELTDKVYYENLQPGVEYTVVGTLHYVNSGEESGKDENGEDKDGLEGKDDGTGDGAGAGAENGAGAGAEGADGAGAGEGSADAGVPNGAPITAPAAKATISDGGHGGAGYATTGDAATGGAQTPTTGEAGDTGDVTLPVPDIDPNATDGGVVTDASGNPVTASATFTPDKETGTVDVKFTVDGSRLRGKTTVVYERLIRGGVEFARHENPGDKGQTVTFPDAHTTLKDDQGNHDVQADAKVTLVDTVKYTGLVPGRTYTVTGTLHDRETGEAAKDADGKEITASAEFTPEQSDGSVDVTFTFDASALGGHSVVAFETVSSDGKEWVTHADIHDEDQTVDIPKIGTTMTDRLDGLHETTTASDVELRDHVAYQNLMPETEYDLSGVLHVRDATGKDLGVLLDDGSVWDPATGKTTKLESDAVDMSKVKGYEPPAGGSDANDGSDSSGSGTDGTGTDGSDEGSGSGVTAGETVRTLESDGSKRYLPVDQTGIAAGSYVLTVNATQAMTLSVIRGGVLAQDGSGMQGGTVAWTATVPAGAKNRTLQVSVAEGDYLGYTGKGEVIVAKPGSSDAATRAVAAAVDAVMPKDDTSDPAGTGNTADEGTGEGTDTDVTDGGDASGDVADAGNGAAGDGTDGAVDGNGSDDGADGQAQPSATALELQKAWGDLPQNAVVATTTFKTGAALNGMPRVSGSADVTFKFKVPDLRGRTLVAFERLGRAGRTIAVHAEIGDDGQSVTTPNIGTKLVNADNGSQTITAGYTSLVDTVGYENLLPDTTYKVTGTLHVKGDDGKDAGVLYTDGSVRAYEGGGATTVTPDTGDAATGDATGEDQTQPAAGDGTDGAAADDGAGADGNATGEARPVTASTTFVTPKAADGEKRVSGSVQVTFEFPDTTKVENKTVVAFESLSRDGRELVAHADIDDEGQSVTVKPRPKRPQTPTTPGTPEQPGKPTTPEKFLEQTGTGILAALLIAGGAAAATYGYRRLRARGGDADGDAPDDGGEE